MKLTTTLNKIREHSPCIEGWRKLLAHLGKREADDVNINLLTILESNGVQDMLWCLRATEQDSRRVSAQLAIEFAEQALSIFEARYPNDLRPRQSIKAARDYLGGGIDLESLREARAAAYAASYASAADAAAYAASYASADAADAAAAAASTSAAYAAAASTSAAAYAAAAAASTSAAAYAAAAAADAAREKVRQKQAEIIRKHLET